MGSNRELRELRMGNGKEWGREGMVGNGKWKWGNGEMGKWVGNGGQTLIAFDCFDCFDCCLGFHGNLGIGNWGIGVRNWGQTLIALVVYCL